MKIARLLVCAALALGASPVLAQAYPARPVTLIVPFPAGSATDLIARSPADGHTLLVATNTHVAAVSLYKRLPSTSHA